jgi:cytochrome P450
MTYQKRIERGDDPLPKGRYIEFLGALSEDPFAALQKLGHHPPFWVDDPNDVDGYWVATRFEDVHHILQNAETFSSLDAQIPFVQMADPLLPTESDPPHTQKLRNVIAPYMTPKRINSLEPRMKAVCREIIEGFRSKGRCDVAEQFARVYPITIFIEFFGLPAERKEEFRQQATVFLHHAERRAGAWSRIRAIVQETLVARRENPQDDLLSAIGNGHVDGEQVDLLTAVNLASTVFLGGLDTLPSNIAWSFHFLATHPEYRRQLIEHPELIVPGAVEEFLRLYSVANPLRRVTRNVEFSGANFVAGDRILCSIASADRDVAVFGETVNFKRTTNRHLTFAVGPHRCLGSHLARHELGVALKIWHELIPDYRLAPGAQLRFLGPIFALDNLPLEWDA